MRKLIIAALTVVALAFTVPQAVRTAGFTSAGGLTSPVGVGDGGTGATSLTDGGVLLGSGTGAITPMAVLADGEFVVGDGSGDPVAESGEDVRLSFGLSSIDTATLDSLTINTTMQTAQLDVIHTATEVDDHALEIDVDAAGFGDVKGLDIDYITGAIAAGSEDSIILVNIDESASTGGEVHGFEVLSTTGNALIEAIHVGVGVAPLHQSVGTFGDMDSALVLAVNRLTEFTSTDSDIVMFVADNDTVTIGDAAQFGEIEFLLDTVASGAGVKPTFEFSTTVDAWQAFVPTDGTNGFRNSGIIDYDPDNLSGWIVGTGSEFLIRITRTANGLVTTPIENLVQIAATTSFTWDASANLTINDVTASTATVDILNISGAIGDFRLFNGTVPTASPTDGIVLFASDDAASSRLWLRDEAGNQEQVLRGSVDGTEIRLGSDAQGDIMFFNGTDWVRLAAATTSGDRLESQGSGANPAFIHNPAFSVHKNGTDQQIDPDTDTKLVWATKLFDTTGDFDIVTNERWTPSVAGKYLLTGNWRSSTNLDDGDPSVVFIFKNGSEAHSMTVRGSGTGIRSHQIAVIVDANGSTDFFELFGRHSTTTGASADGAATDTWFMGQRIGP